LVHYDSQEKLLRCDSTVFATEPNKIILGLEVVREFSESAKKWLPKWLVSDALPPSSRDPLGLQANAEHLANQLLPGLTVFTNRVGYFFFLAWALRELNRYEGIDIGDRLDRLNRLERALVLSESLYHGQDHLKDCKHQGQRSKGHLLAQVGKTAPIPDRILKNQNNTGCYNLYRTPMRSCGFWVDDDEAAIQGFLPFRLTYLGEKLANSFAHRDGVEPLFKWALSEMGRKNIDTLKQWCESFCFCTFHRRSDKRLFLEGFLFAGGEALDSVNEADRRLQTLQTLAKAGLIFQTYPHLSDNAGIISSETAGADITELDTNDSGGDSTILLEFYNKRHHAGSEPFVAAAIYEMLALGLNAIWSDLMAYVKDHDKEPLNRWVESIIERSNEKSFWKNPIKISILTINKTEDQLIQDLFRGIYRAENGLMLAIKVLSRNDNLKVLDQNLSDMELYFRIKEELLSESYDSIEALLPQLAHILLSRHRKVSELKAKRLWLDLNGDDVCLVDNHEMLLGFHSYRFRQLESLIQDLKLEEDELPND